MTEQALWRNQLHAHSLCASCKKQDAYTLAGRWLCAECTEKVNAQYKERYLDNRESINARRRAKIAERKAAGICINCGNRPAAPGKTRCEICLAKWRKYTAKCRAMQGVNIPRGGNGMCFTCNAAPSVDGYRLCPQCLAQTRLSAAKGRAKALEKKVGGGHLWEKLDGVIFQKQTESADTAKFSAPELL